jgi:MFS family permease
LEQEKEAGMADKNPNTVDFDGPDNLENPMNWSSSRKITAIISVTAMAFLSPLDSTIASSASLHILQHFSSTSSTLGSFVTTVFLLGYVFGPILLAPLLEMYGRVPLYKTCMLLFAIFNVACALSPNLGALIAFRFLAGVMGSCPMTIGTGLLLICCL